MVIMKKSISFPPTLLSAFTCLLFLLSSWLCQLQASTLPKEQSVTSHDAASTHDVSSVRHYPHTGLNYNRELQYTVISGVRSGSNLPQTLPNQQENHAVIKHPSIEDAARLPAQGWPRDPRRWRGGIPTSADLRLQQIQRTNRRRLVKQLSRRHFGKIRKLPNAEKVTKLQIPIDKKEARLTPKYLLDLYNIYSRRKDGPPSWDTIRGFTNINSGKTHLRRISMKYFVRPA